MTVEEKKRILRSYRQLDESIEQLRREYEKAQKCDTYTNPLSQEKIGGASHGSVVEVAVEKRDVDYEQMIKEELEKLCGLCVAIKKAIYTLDINEERRVLCLYYLGERDRCGALRFLTICDIANKLSYSERQIYRIHKAALIHLPDIEI